MKTSTALFALIPELLLLTIHETNAEWKQLEGLSTRIDEVIVDNGGIICADYKGIYSSPDKNINWTTLDTVISHESVSCLLLVKGLIYAGTEYGLYISRNNGSTWSKNDSGLTDKTVRSLAAVGDTIFAGTMDGVFRSVANENRWVKKSKGIEGTIITSFATINNFVYAGTFEDGVFFSTDNGENWTEAYGPPNPRGAFYAVTSLTANGNYVFVGTSFGVYRSILSDTNWLEKSSGMTGSAVETFAVSGNTIFTGTELGGVFFSNDFGDNWFAANDGLSSTYILSLAVNENILYAGTYGGLGGVWYRPVSEITKVLRPNQKREITDETAGNFRIQNRFKTDLRFEFFLSVSKHINIELYNSAGRKLASIVNKSLEPGDHIITYNRKALDNGYYIARIQTGKNTFSRIVSLY